MFIFIKTFFGFNSEIFSVILQILNSLVFIHTVSVLICFVVKNSNISV